LVIGPDLGLFVNRAPGQRALEPVASLPRYVVDAPSVNSFKNTRPSLETLSGSSYRHLKRLPFSPSTYKYKYRTRTIIKK